MQGALELLGIPYTGSRRDGLGDRDGQGHDQAHLARRGPADAALRACCAAATSDARARARGARRPRPAADRQAAARRLVDRHHQGDAATRRCRTRSTLAAQLRRRRAVRGVHRRRRGDLPGARRGRRARARCRSSASSRPRATTTTRTSTSPTTRSTSCPAACRPTRRREIQRIVARRLPRARLPRLGPRRPDAARRRPQALPARDEHLARHDRPFAGADVGARGRHQLRGPLPAAAGRRALDAARAPQPGADAMATARCHACPLPFDVRADERHRDGAVRRCWRCVLLAAALLVARCASRCSRSARSRSKATSRTTASSTIRANAAPQLAGNFFTLDLRAARARLRVGALGAPGGRAARLAEPPARAAARSTGRSALWGSDERRRQAGQQLRRGVRGQRRRRRGRRPADARRARTAARRRCWRCTGALEPLFAPLELRASTRWRCRRAAAWQRELDNGAVVELGRGSDDEVVGAHAALRRAR